MESDFSHQPFMLGIHSIYLSLRIRKGKMWIFGVHFNHSLLLWFFRFTQRIYILSESHSIIYNNKIIKDSLHRYVFFKNIINFFKIFYFKGWFPLIWIIPLANYFYRQYLNDICILHIWYLRILPECVIIRYPSVRVLSEHYFRAHFSVLAFWNHGQVNRNSLSLHQKCNLFLPC